MISGSIVAIVTPMKASSSSVKLELDLECLKDLCLWHIEQGTNGIVVMGTTGESATVTEEDYVSAIKAVVETVDGRVPVIAGTGTIGTAKTIQMTQLASDLGVDGALIATPYYCKPSQKGLIEHYTAIADAVELPIVLYNVPGRTACDLLPESVAVLAEHKNIIGIKEATGDVSRVKELIEGCDTPMKLLSGDDATSCEFMKAGGDGVISVTANVAPALMSDMCRLALDGKSQQAQIVDKKLSGLHQDLFLEANPIPVKWAMSAMGKIEDALLLPLTSLDKQFQPAILKALDQANVKTQ